VFLVHRVIALQFAAASLGTAAEISFTRHIAPVLVEQCVECHRAGKVKGSYRLDTWQSLQKPGESEAPPLMPGKPEQSELYRLLVTHDEDDRMPKKADPLPASDLQLIREWLQAGAMFDGPAEAQSQPLLSLIPAKAAKEAPARYPAPLPVTALALSPDLQTLAVSGYHEVTLWNPETKELLQRLGGLPERILALEWLPSNDTPPSLLAAGGVPGRSGELWLIDPAKARGPHRRLLQTRDCLMCLVISPGLERLVVAGAENGLRCISIPSGELLWEAEIHADWVLDLALSPDGRHVATASRDRTARLINIQNGEIDATFTAHTSPVTSVTFAGDGKSVFSGSADGEIRRWTLEGEGIKDSTLRAGKAEVTSLALADDLLWAALADGRVLPLDPKARKALDPAVTSKDRMEIVRTIRSEDRWHVFSGGLDGQVHCFPQPPPATAKDSKSDPKSPVAKTHASSPQALPPLHFTPSPGWSAPTP
jgi:hypothetical protein